MKVSVRAAQAVDWLLPVAMTAVAVVHPQPLLFLGSLLFAFAVIAPPLIGGCWVMHRVSLRWGRRIQGERRAPPPIGKEIFETARAMYVVACIAAWPIAQHRMGEPTALTWSLEDAAGGSVAMVLLQFGVGIVAADFWTYWKHRILHTRALFAFHRNHHAFRDPTVFAGFAISPVESLLTFCPIFILCWPPAVHWAPVYFGLIGGFVVLNYYLHCGVTYGWAEKWLPRLGLNTSAWHNVHHSHATANYGEMSFLWDRICGTSLAALEKKKRDKSEGARRPEAATTG